MKVCIFIPRLNSGGAEKAAICQANALSNSNHEVTLLVLDPSNPMTPINDRVEIKPLCKRMRYAIFVLPYYFFMEKPDIIVSHLSVANFICSLVSIFFKNILSIITIQNDLTYKIKKKNYSALIELLIIIVSNKLCDHAIAVSVGVKKFLTETAYLDKRKVDVAYNPISTKITKNSPKILKDCVEVKNISKYIIAVGRLVPQKGFDILIKSYSQTELPKNNIELVIVGEGPLRQQLENLSIQLNIEKLVKFTGYLEDLSDLYSNAEFFVLSSRWEGFGNVVVEALAHDLRVVAFDCPSGPKEIIQGLQDCILVPFSDTPEVDLRKSIDAMLNKKIIDRKKLRERAEDFSVDNAGKSFCKILEKVKH